MPELKERPKDRKRSSKPVVAALLQQAAQMIGEKCGQQQNHQSEEMDSGVTDYAVGQVEEAGPFAVDGAVHFYSHKGHKNLLKEKPGSRRKKASVVERAEREDNQAVSRREIRKTMLKTSDGERQDIQAELKVDDPEVRVSHTGHNSFAESRMTEIKRAPVGKSGLASTFKERPRPAIKTRPDLMPEKHQVPPAKVYLSARQGIRGSATQRARQQMIQQMVTQAQKTPKRIMAVAKKMGEAVVRATTALVGSLAGLLGGGFLILLLFLVIAIAAVASSPFGILLAEEHTAPDTLSVAEAVAQVSAAYSARLVELQTGDYDVIKIQGQAPDWADVLAVFAARYAGADDGVDVATLDADRVDKLMTTFWDMTEISSTVETVDHPDSAPDDDIDDSWIEYILHITITPKQVGEMEHSYGFTTTQREAVTELLAHRWALSSLAKSLTITNPEVLAVLDNLPDNLAQERRKVVETALQLVGKVNYFWGGKSRAIGWDNRWGQIRKVTALGSFTTGTYRSYGLDCTGFIDWALCNAGLPSDGQWHIGTNLIEVTQAEALPGDIALNLDASHVGLVVGRDNAGNLLICHCSLSDNGVVISRSTAGAFASIGRLSVHSL